MNDAEMLELKALRDLLFDAIIELDYVQEVEDHSLCKSSQAARIIKRGMELLGVKDLSGETLGR